LLGAGLILDARKGLDGFGQRLEDLLDLLLGFLDVGPTREGQGQQQKGGEHAFHHLAPIVFSASTAFLRTSSSSSCRTASSVDTAFLAAGPIEASATQTEERTPFVSSLRLWIKNGTAGPAFSPARPIDWAVHFLQSALPCCSA